MSTKQQPFHGMRHAAWAKRAKRLGIFLALNVSTAMTQKGDSMAADKLKLRRGTRVRTGGTTYEVQEETTVPAGLVPVTPQSTRLLKVQCETCGYTCRVTHKWIVAAGTPVCPTDMVPMVQEIKVTATVAATETTVATETETPDTETETETAETVASSASALAQLLDTL